MATKKAKLPRSISRIGYAMITATSDEGVDTYGEVKMLPHIEGGREYTLIIQAGQIFDSAIAKGMRFIGML